MKLMDMMIMQNRFCEFINEVIRLRNEELEEKTIWEIWLHKVFDESFADFKNRLTFGTNAETVKKEDIETTVHNSFVLLDGFVPDGVNENDGTVSAIGNGGG